LMLLEKKKLVEFPTIHIVLPTHIQSYPKFIPKFLKNADNPNKFDEATSAPISTTDSNRELVLTERAGQEEEEIKIEDEEEQQVENQPIDMLIAITTAIKSDASSK